jgi:hypothetical protein
MTLDSDGNQDVGAIEERLRSELSAAHNALDAASTKHRELDRLCRFWRTTSDGTVTLREMQELHTLAARRYRDALRRFSDFVVEGKQG